MSLTTRFISTARLVQLLPLFLLHKLLFSARHPFLPFEVSLVFFLCTSHSPSSLSSNETGTVVSAMVAALLLRVATFIVQKILLDDVGLRYICTTAERFFAVGTVLANMVVSLVEQPSTRLLKHIIRCYLRLSDNPRACEALQNCLPEMLKDGTFNNCLRDDTATRRWLQQLLHNISGGGLVSSIQPGGLEHMLGN